MALEYTPSTEKVAKSYQRTAQMVPNLGVSALAVVNGRVNIEQPTDAITTLSSPVAGMNLRRNSMSYSVRTRRSRGGVKIRINRRRLSRNLDYTALADPRFRAAFEKSMAARTTSGGHRSRRLSRNVNYALMGNRRRSRRLSRNVNYALMGNRRRSRRVHSNRRRSRRLSRNVNYALMGNRRRSRRLSHNVNYAIVSNRRRSRRRGGF